MSETVSPKSGSNIPTIGAFFTSTFSCLPSSCENNKGLIADTIFVCWNGTDVSTDIQNLGDGYYFISLHPIFVRQNDPPILLNLSVILSGYEEKYMEFNISVKECDIPNPLLLKLNEHNYSEQEFNFTIIIQDQLGQFIDFATIQAWWNGTDVSADILNLGSGLYFIRVDPITIAPGEEPILLKIMVTADGYDSAILETHIAVDPDLIAKETLEPPPPMIPGYNVILLIALIGVTFIFIYKFKKLIK